MAGAYITGLLLFYTITARKKSLPDARCDKDAVSLIRKLAVTGGGGRGRIKVNAAASASAAAVREWHDVAVATLIDVSITVVPVAPCQLCTLLQQQTSVPERCCCRWCCCCSLHSSDEWVLIDTAFRHSLPERDTNWSFIRYSHWLLFCLDDAGGPRVIPFKDLRKTTAQHRVHFSIHVRKCDVIHLTATGVIWRLKY